MSHLKAIHSKRRQVASLKDDDTWRDFVELHTGQRSTKNLSNKQAMALIKALNDLGAPDVRAKGPALDGPFSKKIVALWIACWNLGLVSTASNKALMAFVRKQCGIDHVDWIRDAKNGRAVVEALKSMLAREGVDWSPIDPSEPAYMDTPGFRIASAQLAKAGDTLGIRKYVDLVLDTDPEELTSEQWIEVMNGLGRRLRYRAEAK